VGELLSSTFCIFSVDGNSNSDDIQLDPVKDQQFKVTKFYLRIIQGVLPVDRRPVRQMFVHCSCLVLWLTVLIISLKSIANCRLQSKDRTWISLLDHEGQKNMSPVQLQIYDSASLDSTPKPSKSLAIWPQRHFRSQDGRPLA